MVMVGALALAAGACGGDDDGGSGSGEWCDVARDVEAQFDGFDDIDFTDPESLEDAFQQMIDGLEDAADSAPDEIEDDLQLTVDGFNDLFEALRDVDFDFLELEQSTLESSELDAASDRIEAYNERECGIVSDSDETDETDEIDEIDETDVTDGTAGSDSDSGDDDTISGEGTFRDEMVRQFTAMGMSEDQANCLVDNIDLEEVAASGAEDPSMFFELFETCGIDLSDLQPGG